MVVWQQAIPLIHSAIFTLCPTKSKLRYALTIGGGSLHGQRLARLEDVDGVIGARGRFDELLGVDRNDRPGVVMHGHHHNRAGVHVQPELDDPGASTGSVCES